MEAPLLLPVSNTVEAPSSPPPNTASSSPVSTRSIVFRVVTVLAVACASLFAQHEASKGFGIDVVNGAPRNSAAGRRFHLLFVSNGRAERILHRASRGVERALFPDASFPRKPVARVTVRMAGHNLTADDAATVDAGARGEYVFSLSPGLVMSSSTDAVAAAVRRAVARMWLWDGRGAAPARVTESMVEYLVSSGAGEEDEQQCMSARFPRHLEQRRGGFVARLNRVMRDRWSDASATCLRGVPRGGDGEAGRYVWVQRGSVRRQLATKGSPVWVTVQCVVSMNDSWLVVSEVSLSGSTAVSVGDAIICDSVCETSENCSQAAVNPALDEHSLYHLALAATKTNAWLRKLQQAIMYGPSKSNE